MGGWKIWNTVRVLSVNSTHMNLTPLCYDLFYATTEIFCGPRYALGEKYRIGEKIRQLQESVMKEFAVRGVQPLSSAASTPSSMFMSEVPNDLGGDHNVTSLGMFERQLEAVHSDVDFEKFFREATESSADHPTSVGVTLTPCSAHQPPSHVRTYTIVSLTYPVHRSYFLQLSFCLHYWLLLKTMEKILIVHSS